jgi:hypothetical protein
VGTPVGVSVVTAGSEASVGGVSIAGGGAVAVKMAAVGDCGEQEMRKRKKERRIRDVKRWGMGGILTELPANHVPCVNEKTSRQVPDRMVR